MKIDWPFTKWPAIHIPAEADEDASAKALIMRCGGYKAALRVLKRNRNWSPAPPERHADDRVLLDIAHAEQVNPGSIENARRDWRELVESAGHSWPASMNSHARAIWEGGETPKELGNPANYEQAKCSDTAALKKVANLAYRGKAAAAALRRLRYMLRPRNKNDKYDPLHLWWRKRWGKFLELSVFPFRRTPPEN